MHASHWTLLFIGFRLDPWTYLDLPTHPGLHPMDSESRCLWNELGSTIMPATLDYGQHRLVILISHLLLSAESLGRGIPRLAARLCCFFYSGHFGAGC
jgi:hypothetical protein